MNYHNITKCDQLNGPGLRVVLWVAGCGHRCTGCQNPQTWDAKGGIPFDETAEEELFEELGKPWTSGITFSGGDPLYPANRAEVARLARKAKEEFPDKTVWIYTGYTYKNVAGLPLLKYADALVDGPFVVALKDDGMHWRGSSNQRIWGGFAEGCPRILNDEETS